LRASISGRDLPEDVKQKLLALHEENVRYQEEVRAANEKLIKAKKV
jgi:protein HOOK3